MELKSQTKSDSGISVAAKPQYIRFVCYKIDPSFRKLDMNMRVQAKEEALTGFDMFREKMIISTYSLLATRAEADFLIWQVADDLDIFDEFAAHLSRTSFGPYLTRIHSFLTMTVNPLSPDKIGSTRDCRPAQNRFLYIRSAARTGAWQQLPLPERQKMMEEYVGVVAKYPSVKFSIFHSFGLDDHDLVFIFESDDWKSPQNLIQELRETKASQYFRRDTPALAGLNREPKWIFDAVG
ncbi:MAG: chlorite dismutase family protein [Elusimicrobia bacterium]|nr:chlorite dismutase family protein [Elusimicrobiota bacterium]